jgi:hypothetical protein
MTYGLSQSRLHSLVRQRALASMFIASVSGPGSDLSASSVSCLGGLCVSALPLNLQLPTLNPESLAAIIAQPPYFHNLPHSFKTSPKSPFVFITLETPSPVTSFFLQPYKMTGGIPPPYEKKGSRIQLTPISSVARARLQC